MAEAEQISFDFTGADRLESLQRLENIMSSGHWSDKGFRSEDEWSWTLLGLLQNGGIVVYRRSYADTKDISDEIRERARDFESLMGKRSMSAEILGIAHVFSDLAYRKEKSKYNTLYFPKIKAYVRCGGLSPERLVDLLAQEDCDAVMLFGERYEGEEPAFHAFMSAMPREALLAEVKKTEERIIAKMHEVSRMMESETKDIYPKLTKLVD